MSPLAPHAFLGMPSIFIFDFMCKIHVISIIRTFYFSKRIFFANVVKIKHKNMSSLKVIHTAQFSMIDNDLWLVGQLFAN